MTLVNALTKRKFSKAVESNKCAVPRLKFIANPSLADNSVERSSFRSESL